MAVILLIFPIVILYMCRARKVPFTCIDQRTGGTIKGKVSFSGLWNEDHAIALLRTDLSNKGVVPVKVKF